MSHGEKMSLYGKILALQDTMLYAQKEINKLRKQLQTISSTSISACFTAPIFILLQLFI